MSNELAIATVTAALGQSLGNAFVKDGLGFAASVTNVRPNAADTALPTTGANIFLFLVTPNAANRNVDVPTRRADGTLLRAPTVALDLHYLISFYGDEAQLEPQILLGSAVRALQEEPVLSSATIREMLATNRYSFLQNSDLADAPQPVRFTPASLSLEELSKLWSVVFQTPYVLSVVYQAGVVFIRRDQPVAAILPVLLPPNVVAIPLPGPTIARVLSQATVSGAAQFVDNQPILAGAILAIEGQRLSAPDTTVQIDGTSVPASATTDTQITVSLPSALPAGVREVQVVRGVDFQFPPAEPGRAGGASLVRPGVLTSNIATFVLRPQVTAATVQSTGGTGSVTVTVAPSIGQQQRLRLLLNQTGTPDGQSALSYAFGIPPRGTGAPDATLALPMSGVTPGTYLVRVEVDGTESTQAGNVTSPVVNVT